MAKAYAIAEIEVTDPAAYGKYREAVAPTLSQYGAKPLVANGKVDRREGEWDPDGRLVVLEFEGVEQARRWYESPEYQAAIALRQPASRAQLIIVEGR